VQIARLDSSASLADLAARVYGLPARDRRIAAAAQALAQANPHLGQNFAALPPNTPVVVPDLPGLAATIPNPIGPTRAAVVSVLENLQKTAELASNAQQSGSTTGPAPQPDPARGRALERLAADIAEFAKIHAG
jgi:hypothetical protein